MRVNTTADAGRILAAFGYDCAAIDVDRPVAATPTTADAGTIGATRGIDVATVDGDRPLIVIIAIISRADVGTAFSTRGSDFATVDGNSLEACLAVVASVAGADGRIVM